VAESRKEDVAVDLQLLAKLAQLHPLWTVTSNREGGSRMPPEKIREGASVVVSPFFSIKRHACTQRQPPSGGAVR
jgi:hypothetical protein